MQEASRMFQAAGWKDYSEARVRLFVTRMDEKWQNKKDDEQGK
jgi:hypothetical protein